MQLSEFIRETLIQIVTGIQSAQQDEVLSKSNGAIVPTGQGISDDSYINQLVEFDVAVATQSGKETKGGVGIVVGAFALGSSGKSDSAREATNRIKFSVPVYLPSQNIRRQKG